jgi:hypothetical protein
VINTATTPSFESIEITVGVGVIQYKCRLRVITTKKTWKRDLEQKTKHLTIKCIRLGLDLLSHLTPLFCKVTLLILMVMHRRLQ